MATVAGELRQRDRTRHRIPLLGFFQQDPGQVLPMEKASAWWRLWLGMETISISGRGSRVSLQVQPLAFPGAGCAAAAAAQVFPLPRSGESQHCEGEKGADFSLMVCYHCNYV